jgi:hypothetical protein
MKVKPSLAALSISLCPAYSGKGGLHVEDGVGNDLGVDSDLVGSLGQGPDDGVSSPEAGISSARDRARGRPTPWSSS